MIHRINVILLSLIVAFAPVHIYASNNQIDQAIKKIDDLRNKINNMSIDINKTRKSATGTVRTIADIVNEAGQKQTVARTAVVEQKLNKISLGQNFIKRLKSVGKLTGPALIGTVAVQGLLEAVGWVMEDGQMVKYKDKSTDPNAPQFQYYWVTVYDPITRATTAAASAQKMLTETCRINDYKKCSVVSVTYENPDKAKMTYHTYYTDNQVEPQVRVQYPARIKNPLYDPSKPAEKEKVVLTPEQAGSAMMGEGYDDPVDTSLNNRINNDTYTGVREAYEADPSGVGNEPNNDILTRAKTATPTSDGKPAPSGDPRYTNVLKDDKDSSNDRVWNDDGSQATTEPKKDEDGNPTGESTTTFPVFCEWAHVVCDWYDDWKVSDQVYKDHIDEEKSFWTKVTDWFDWTKEEPDDEQEPEQPEIDDRGIFSRTFDTVFSLSKQCPPDIPYQLDAYYFKGSYTISLNWLCMIFTFLGYPLQLASHCIGLWIMYEAVIRKEIKW